MDEQRKPTGIDRAKDRTNFLRDSTRWGETVARFGSGYRTSVDVIHFRDLAPSDVVFAIGSGSFSMQESLSPAEARRIAAALLACADEAEQAAAVAQEAA